MPGSAATIAPSVTQNGLPRALCAQAGYDFYIFFKRTQKPVLKLYPEFAFHCSQRARTEQQTITMMLSCKFKTSKMWLLFWQKTRFFVNNFFSKKNFKNREPLLCLP